MNLQKRLEKLEKQAAKHDNFIIKSETLYDYMLEMKIISKSRYKELNALSEAVKRNPFEPLREEELRFLLSLS